MRILGYFDEHFQLTDPENAILVKVEEDDGSIIFGYVVKDENTQVVAKQDVAKAVSDLQSMPKWVQGSLPRLSIKKGGPGSGHHGHSGRPGKVGGSLPGNSTSASLPDDVKVFNWDTDDFNKTVTRVRSDGFVQFYRLNGPKDGGPGEYSVYTDAYSTSSENLGRHKANSAEEALQMAMAYESEHKQQLEDKLQNVVKRLDDADYNELGDAQWKYHDSPTKNTLGSLVELVTRNHAYYTLAKQGVEQLPFDENGEITLYRGGSEDGLSWSIDKSEAERFARYGFGGVNIQASGLVGVHAIMSGAADKPVSVFTRKFKKSQILHNMSNMGEGEVIVDPKALGWTDEDISNLSYSAYDDEEEDYNDYEYDEYKGGEGSGHHGHSGRPGKVGGSTPSVSLTTIDPISKKESGKTLTEEQKAIIEETVSDIHKIARMENPHAIIIGESGARIAGKSDPFGRSTRIDGKDYIYLSPDRVLEPSQLGKGSTYDRKTWFGFPDADNPDSLLRHIVAHEYGHLWWKQKSVKSADLVKLPSGNKGRVETNSILNEWRDSLWKEHRQSMSGYAKFNGSFEEGFADMFANYILGYDVPSQIEEWFRKHL